MCVDSVQHVTKLQSYYYYFSLLIEIIIRLEIFDTSLAQNFLFVLLPTIKVNREIFSFYYIIGCDMFICMNVCVRTCMCAWVYVCVCVCMYMYLCVYIYTCILCRCVYVCVLMHIYVYMYLLAFILYTCFLCFFLELKKKFIFKSKMTNVTFFLWQNFLWIN